MDHNSIVHGIMKLSVKVALEMFFTILITLVPVLLTFYTLCVEQFTQVIKLIHCFYSVHDENRPGNLN